jgi:hypothetical protein
MIGTAGLLLQFLDNRGGVFARMQGKGEGASAGRHVPTWDAERAAKAGGF